MNRDELLALADRVEALTGPSEDVRREVIKALYELRVPIAFYGGPINYDPDLWMERHGFDPLSSLDAATTLVPESAFWRVGHDGEGADPAFFRADVGDPVEFGFRRAIALTAPIALAAAALRALAAQGGKSS